MKDECKMPLFEVYCNELLMKEAMKYLIDMFVKTMQHNYKILLN